MSDDRITQLSEQGCGKWFTAGDGFNVWAGAVCGEGASLCAECRDKGKS